MSNGHASFDYICAVCGCRDVQHAMWVGVNEGTVHEDFGSWCAGDNSYCPECDVAGRDAHPQLSELWTFYSERNIPLAGTFKDERDKSILTVELYMKWYRLYVITPDREVIAVGFDQLDTVFKEGSAYVDHAPNPAAVRAYAESKGYYINDLAEELLVGRWQLEVVESGSER